MAVLAFKVEAEYDEVTKLREEILKLKNELKGINGSLNPGKFNETNNKLAQTSSRFNELTSAAKNAGTTIVSEGDLINQALTKVAAGVAGAFAVDKVKDFVMQVVNVRGQFQQLEIAFKTMLGSGEKASKLMDQLVQTAATTPFDLQGVAQGAKQLLAYGTAAEDVNDTLIKLGDIAAGLSLPLGDLVYLYGTTVAQGRMFTQDMRQFMGRGIPLAEEVAKVMGVTEKEVAGLVTAGKVTADVFKKAIDGMAAEGGKFGGLMAAQSQTITGQISNIEDAIDMMFNDLGKQSEGVINTALSGVSYLVENYQEVGRQIGALVTAYGAYKAALITLTAIQRLNMAVLRQAALEKQLAAAQGIALSNAEAIAAARTKLLTLAQQGLIKAIKGVTAALATNPYTLAALAVAALAVGIYELATAESEAEKRTKAMNNAVENQKKAVDNFRQHNQDLINAATDETKSTYQRIEAYNELKQTMPELVDKYEDLEALTKAMKEDGARPAALDSADIEKMKQDAEKWKGYLEDLQKLQDIFGGVNNRALNWFDIGQFAEQTGMSEADAKAFVERLKAIRQELIDSGEDITHWYNTQSSELAKSYSLVAGKADAMAKVYEDAANRMKEADLIDQQKKEQEEFDNTYDSIDKTKDAIAHYTTEVEKLKQQTKGNAFSVITEIVTKEEPKHWYAALKDRMAEITNANPLTIAAQVEVSGLESLLDRLQNRLNSLTNDNLDTAYQKAKTEWEQAKKLVEEMEKPKNRSKYTAKAYQNAVADRDEKAKTFRGLGGNTSTKTTTPRTTTPTETAAERQARLRNAHQRTMDLVEKNALDLKRKEEDLQYEANLARINAMQDGFDKEQQLRDLNHQKTIRDLEREKEDTISAIKEAAKAEFDAAEAEKKEKNKKYVAKTFDWDKDASDEYKTKASTVSNIYDDRINSQKTINKNEDAVAANNYLDQYKGYLEKRKDIDEKFAQDEAALREKYKTDGGGVSQDGEAAIAELNRQKEETINSLSEEVAMRQEDFEAWANSITNLSLEQLETMIADAKAELEKVEKDPNATAEQKAKAQAKVSVLNKQAKEVRVNKDAPTKRTIKQWKNLNDALESTSDNLREIGETLGGDVGKIITTTSDFATSILGMVNGIVTLVNYSTDGMKLTAETASTAIQTVEKASVILAIISAALQIAMKIASLFKKDPYGEYNEEKKRVEAIAKVWDDLIAKKQEYISTTFADDARKTTQEAIDLINKETEAYRNLGKMRLNSGASAGSHSVGIKMNKALTDKDRSDIAKAANEAGFSYAAVTNGKMKGLFDLSAEQLKVLKETAVEFWAKMDEDTRTYLENIIEAEETAEEVQNTLKESLTGISFDSMKDDFIENLMDMEYSAKDFANDTNEMFANALVTQMVNKNYKDKLQKIYDDMADAIGKEDEQQRIDRIKKDYEAIRNSAKAEADKIMEITGYDKTSQQDGDSGGFEAMSQDTAEELSGRFTMLQITSQNQYQRINEIQGSLTGMLAIIRDAYNIHNDARTILSESLLELRAISENTAVSKQLLPMVETIAKKVKDSL